MNDGTNTYDGTYASDNRGHGWSQVNDAFTQAMPDYDRESYNQWNSNNRYDAIVRESELY